MSPATVAQLRLFQVLPRAVILAMWRFQVVQALRVLGTSALLLVAQDLPQVELQSLQAEAR
jgi:hypothetical protein